MWWWIRYRLNRWASRLRRWIDPLAGTDARRYKTAREIALENAAAELNLDPAFPYVEEWEVPVEGVDYPAFDLTPETEARLDAWGAEMSLYGRRQQAIRRRRKSKRRRRLGGLVASSLLVLGCVGAGANALGVDVPLIHNAVDLLVAGRESPPSSKVATGALNLPRIQRGGRTSGRIEVPAADGKGSVVAVAYQADDAQVCFRVFDSGRAAEANELVAGCWPFARIALINERDSAAVSGVTIAGTTVLTGFASAGVRAIRGRGPDTRLRSALSRRWTPNRDALSDFRVFISVTQIDLGPDGLDISEETRARDLTNYDMRAVLANGTTVPVR
jgi:hypothetical protein